MMRSRNLLTRLSGDSQGAMLIETAIVAPVLILLALGAFQISSIVARQTELQNAAAEAAAIALAAAPDTPEKRTTVEQVIEASSGLAAAQVTVSPAYRCDRLPAYYDTADACASAQVVSSFVKITLTDTYTPTWTHFGVGGPIEYNVTRYVIFQQDEV